MKKTLLSLFAVCTLLLAACDPAEFIEDLVDDLFGEAQITVIDGTGSQTFEFSSGLVNTVTDTAYAGTLLVAASIDLTVDEINLPYPYFGVTLNDTVAGTYAMDTLTLGMFADGTVNANRILTAFKGRNFLIVAESDTSWYVSNGGMVEVDSYPALGAEMDGTVSGTDNAVYISQSRLNAAVDTVAMRVVSYRMRHPAARQTDIDAYVNSMTIGEVFPTVTIGGTFTCRRMNIENIVSALEE